MFQDLEDLIASCAEGSILPMDFECSVFDGFYVTGDVSSVYLAKLESRRNDVSKHKKQLEAEVSESGNWDEDEGQLSLYSNS